jgi:hypothetical protein
LLKKNILERGNISLKKQFLFIGLIVGVFFLAASLPAQACGDCGTGTPGYWKNHPDAWPVDGITIGGVYWCKDDAIAIMDQPVKGNKVITLFKALVAAKLNRWNGCSFKCVYCCVSAGDWWMGEYGYEYDNGNVSLSTVHANSNEWTCPGENIYFCLDDYNNGLLPCAQSRDALE